MSETQLAEQAIQNGTIADSEHLADHEEMVVEYIGDRVSEHTPADQPLVNPFECIDDALGMLLRLSVRDPLANVAIRNIRFAVSLLRKERAESLTAKGHAALMDATCDALDRERKQ